jgi:hypothetical protein
MIIGIRNDQFIAAENRVWLPGGQVITRDNLPEGWREVDPPPDPAEQEPAPIPHTPGQWAEVDQRVEYNGTVYIARQRHIMQADWTPDIVPALFLVEQTGTEWQAGVAYATDDLVTYNGTTYRCIQGHVSQQGWEPPNVPALWAVEP